ncbi:cytochrome P460 family protein [Bacillus sp. NP157]|nr:cytochrome P460 family protein [Bacillus sp. NP157]
MIHARLFVLAATATVAIVAAGHASHAQAATGPVGGKATQGVDASDASGAIHVPKNYRASFEYVGTWSVGGPTQGAAQMHAVYVSPGGTAAYRKDGKFPDGTVLVKEVYEASTAAMTTGAAVSHEETLKGWFVMIKDSKNSHPQNMLWGDGWGWSWFDAGVPMKTTSTNYQTDCKGCHVPAQGTDWIYVQGYPVLKK